MTWLPETGHEDDRVRRRVAEVFPDLVGLGLDALDEHGVPVVGGVGAFFGLPQGFGGAFVARAGDDLDLGAVGTRLQDLAR